MTHLPESTAPAGAKEPVDIGEAILSDADVHRITQLSRTTRWRMQQRGDFPLPLQVAKGRVAYLRSEILTWMQERPRVRPQSAA